MIEVRSSICGHIKIARKTTDPLHTTIQLQIFVVRITQHYHLNYKCWERYVQSDVYRFIDRSISNARKQKRREQSLRELGAARRQGAVHS